MTKRGKVAPKCEAVGPDGRKLCGCGCGKVPEGRRTVWASRECNEAWLLRWHLRAQRNFVFARDGGKCQLCGCLPEQLRAETRSGFGWSYCKTAAENQAARDAAVARWVVAAAEGWPRTSRVWWEMDHVIERADGGVDSVDNLRVVCYRCHKRKSAEARSARAKSRR